MDNRLADTLLRLSGLVTGMKPYAWLGRLEEMQWWGRQAMLEWQAQQLRKMLQHAVETVPHYQRVLPGVAEVTAGNIASILASMPILTKNELREGYDSLLSTLHLARKPLVGITSGSTGKPLRVSIDRPAFARHFASKFRALGWYGVGFADRQIRIWGFPLRRRQRLVVRARDVLQNRLRLVVFDLSSDTLARFYDRCLRFRAVYMNGYATAVWRFADFIIRSGWDGAALGLKLVIPTGEMLYEWQRERIVEAFGCPVMNEYGGAETQAIAYECPAGRWHITHENMLVEVLDDAGSPVPAGQFGNLTITNLCNVALPLIRYQNGDVVALDPEATCACGRHPGLPALQGIAGRSTDVPLRSDGQPTHCSAIYFASREAFQPGMVLEHQARQKSLDSIELSVVRGPKYDDRAMSHFVDCLRDLFGQGMEVEIKFVEEIARERSGKLRYFLSDIVAAQLREERQQ
jgi:phenylacetate-CoA ligase